jgi:hypothetical protein
VKKREEKRKEGHGRKKKNEKKKFVEKNQKISLTSIICSTLRRSPRTEFYQ